MQDDSQGISDGIYRQSPLSIRPLTPVLGAEVIGATQIAGDPAWLGKVLNQLWFQHGILLFRDVGLDEAGEVAFSRLFGELAWHEDFMKRYRYKTKRDAYKTMRFCRAERSEGRISITPHKRDFKPGLWWDLPADRTVIIPATNDPGIAGAAVKLALSHCE